MGNLWSVTSLSDEHRKALAFFGFIDPNVVQNPERFNQKELQKRFETTMHYVHHGYIMNHDKIRILTAAYNTLLTLLDMECVCCICGAKLSEQKLYMCIQKDCAMLFQILCKPCGQFSHRNIDHRFNANGVCIETLEHDEKTLTISGTNAKERQITMVQIQVYIICPRNSIYNDEFETSIPYDHQQLWSIQSMMDNIIQRINDKHKPLQFIPIKIKHESFIDKDIIYDECGCTDFVAHVTDYQHHIIKQNGLHLEIDLKQYEHKINSVQKLCDNIGANNGLCPIYAKMRYQYIFTEKLLNHFYDCNHPDISPCRYGDACHAFKRLENGGNLLNDRCHVMIFTHPPRGRSIKLSEGIKSFCFNDTWCENTSLYHPTLDDAEKVKYKKNDGFLKSLIEEVVKNGYKKDLCLGVDDEKHDNYSLLSVVNQKMNCLRHQMMGSPLNRSEMLSLILYTGGESNYDLCKSQRCNDYKKWKMFDFCLFNAINKLSKREHGCYKLYTGLSAVKLPNKSVQCGYFKTYVSTSWIKFVAIDFVGNSGMIFEIDERYRENAICCDVSWISKFPLECEILVARSIDAVLNSFQCAIVDERNEIQTVLLEDISESK
eukprot:510235_1